MPGSEGLVQILLTLFGALVSVATALIRKKTLMRLACILLLVFVALSLVWIGYEWGKRSVSTSIIPIQTATEGPASAASTSTVPTQAVVEGPASSMSPAFVLTPTVYITISPHELVDWYRRFDTTLQADESAQRYYYGKYVECTAVVKDVNQHILGVNVMLDMDGTTVFADFGKSEEVKVLLKNQKIAVTGRIQRITRDYVSLDSCQMVQAMP